MNRQHSNNTAIVVAVFVVATVFFSLVQLLVAGGYSYDKLQKRLKEMDEVFQ